MRRTLSALALLLAAALLAACGGDETETAEQPPVTAEPQELQADQEQDAEVATVEGVRVSGAEDVSAEPTVVVPSEEEPPGELVTEDLVEGTGERIGEGDQATVQYTGISWSTGAKFDASWDRGAQPFTFTVGGGNVIQGWDEGVEGMRVGGRRVLIIPPELGYGPEGQQPVIAPDETLVFVVDAVAAE